MNQLLSIVDNKLVIEKLQLTHLEGDILHTGSLNIDGRLTLNSDLEVSGAITVDTLHVKNLVTDAVQQADSSTFTATDESQLVGKGLTWVTAPDTKYQFVLRTEPRRIYSTETIDLRSDAKYQIDGVDVLLKGQLGSSIKRSNITKLGILEQLDVDGNTNLGNVVLVNSYLNRVGINIEQPNSTLSVLDNGIEFIVGSYEAGQMNIGTWSNHTINIVTDNTPRIVVQGNTVTFGSPTSKNSVVKINGILEVDSIVSDTRIERTSSFEILEDNETSLHNKGLLWKGNTNVRKFVLYESPSRFYSSESLELNTGKELLIGGTPVLNADTLGSTIKTSSLETVGTLHNLVVGADVNLGDRLVIKDHNVRFNADVNVCQGDDMLTATATGVNTNNSFRIKNKEVQEFAISGQGITIGNRENTTRVINAYGRLSVNTTNPDPEASLTVEGPVVLTGKKFINSDRIPVAGMWNKGDIVWNINPVETSYIGWVCISGGTPGEWRPFGQIGAK